MVVGCSDRPYVDVDLFADEWWVSEEHGVALWLSSDGSLWCDEDGDPHPDPIDNDLCASWSLLPRGWLRIDAEDGPSWDALPQEVGRGCWSVTVGRPIVLERDVVCPLEAL